MAEKILMIALSPTMESGTIIRWNKKEGDLISSGDLICEVETDKAAMDYESSQDGILLKIVAPEGAEVAVGDFIGVLGEKGENIDDLLTSAKDFPGSSGRVVEETESKGAPDKKEPSSAAPYFSKKVAEERLKFSPLAKNMAREAGISLENIVGSGPLGRIIKSDVVNALKNREAGAVLPEKPVVAGAVSAPLPGSVTDEGPAVSDVDRSIPVTGKRKVIARRLSQSAFTAPHYFLRIGVDMTNIIEARRDILEKIGEKVSYNAVLMKFVSIGLQKFPMVNSTWDGDNIIIHPHGDIGLAVAIPDGLITPVVRNCGGKGIIEIEKELKNLVVKAKENRLKPEEFEGATFTLSNLGTYGIEEFTAIINPPASAILAVGEITRRCAVMEGDEIVIKPVAKFTLSCDHRVIDGAVGAAFLQELKNLIESPVRSLY